MARRHAGGRARPGVGAVGARLLFPNDTIQHAGVIVAGNVFGRGVFSPFHCSYGVPANDPSVTTRREYQIVTGACMVTPRALYRELGGLDEIYWNGYEDVDYCLKVRERGLKVVYEPRATLYHFESQSGAQRFRKVWWNIRTLADRWRGNVRFDSSQYQTRMGRVTVLECRDDSFRVVMRQTPPTPVLVHGVTQSTDRDAIAYAVRANASPVEKIVFAPAEGAVAATRELMAVRGDRYLACVHAETVLEPGWLDELIAQATQLPNVAAATVAPELPEGENVGTLAADARCTVLCLRQFPATSRTRRLRYPGRCDCGFAAANRRARARHARRAARSRGAAGAGRRVVRARARDAARGGAR